MQMLQGMSILYTALRMAACFSLSRYTRQKEIDYVLEKLPPVIEKSAFTVTVLGAEQTRSGEDGRVCTGICLIRCSFDSKPAFVLQAFYLSVLCFLSLLPISVCLS